MQTRLEWVVLCAPALAHHAPVEIDLQALKILSEAQNPGVAFGNLCNSRDSDEAQSNRRMFQGFRADVPKSEVWKDRNVPLHTLIRHTAQS